MTRLFIAQPIFGEGLAELDGTDIDVRMREEQGPLPYAELKDGLADYEGLVCLLTDRIDTELLGANPQLRVVANVAVGFDNIDVAAATQAGVAVCNTPEVLTPATADLAFALLLATARRIPEADRFLRDGRYEHWHVVQEHLGADVYGTTLGVFGMGKIGRAVAHRARRGFDMTVIYHDAYRLDASAEEELGVEYVPFEELLHRSDFLTIHAPLTPDTTGVFDAGAFAKMKNSAILINTARGPIVEEAALARALADGEIAGAGLDVYENEPAVNSSLLNLRERVVLLPHLGSATVSTRVRMSRMAVANARDALLGTKPQNCVNPEVFG